ncbi:MAG: UDP-N-acetylmuramate dehydrogenase [Bradymonadaceae bacterium]
MSARSTSLRGELERLARLRDGTSVSFDEPLARHTSLRIGGLVDAWVEVDAVDALERLMSAAGRAARPLRVVGLGSNVLFPDEGLDGVAVRLVGGLADWDVVTERGDRASVRVGAGTVNAHLVRGLHDEGLVGAEFLSLVPGTFGGAVAMNAGTGRGELSDVLRRVRVLVPGSGEGIVERELEPDEIDLGYRHSDLPDGAVVVSGVVEVQRGDVEAARREMREDRHRRDRTQPYKQPSVGSTFANPEDDYAGRLIDEAGLKGEQVGGVRISEEHANFFVNEGGGTAEEFLRLMARARSRVRQEFGVELRPEVRFVGFDGRERLREYERQGC